MSAVIDTVLNADAVEFCPITGFEDLLVCGTYQLEESDKGGRIEQQTRHGRLLMVQTAWSTPNDAAAASASAVVKSTLDVPGVFDIKWCGRTTTDAATPLLGHAAADGFLYLYGAHGYTLKQQSQLNCRTDVTKTENLALSLDWSNRKHAVADPTAAVSMSDGSICFAHMTQTGLTKGMQWSAHDMEAWIVAFNCHDANVLYSGADDAKLKVWDVRTSPSNGAVQTNSRSHEAGVCSIQSHADHEYCFVSGSYDESARVWDSRKLKSPISQINAGGGVWRVKWHPTHDNLLLCASMHGGFTVLNYDHAQGKFEKDSTISYSGGHTSLGYGADWQSPSAKHPRDRWMVGTASFYDHRLEVWDVNTSQAQQSQPQPLEVEVNTEPVTTSVSDVKDFIPGGWRFHDH
eukprot:m.38423 g.38423  ORF g.38423 m.38423 type:complete len:404 (-) comp17910_c0_seq1:78-1289(-)